jgi:hypothetical protein
VPQLAGRPMLGVPACLPASCTAHLDCVDVLQRALLSKTREYLVVRHALHSGAEVVAHHLTGSRRGQGRDRAGQAGGQTLGQAVMRPGRQPGSGAIHKFNTRI